ncbi:MAG: hypothetical protein ABSE89_11325 [Sedimentisphaerales bacterium]
MFGLMIADLITKENQFDIPSLLGKWEFIKSNNYNHMLEEIEKGCCANTFLVFHNNAPLSMSNNNFHTLCDEIVDICLILSFITAKCVTVTGSNPNSDIAFLQLGDRFLRSRAIIGFRALEMIKSFQELFASGISSYQIPIKERRLRLFLSHWLSGLTCFTMEDLFLSACVEMDIVKQCEITKSRQDLNYFKGMKEASQRYGIPELSKDFKNMRNDLIHYGSLSAVNYKAKSKVECAKVVADTLNWIDLYIINVLNMSSALSAGSRWLAKEIEIYLPSISVPS